MNKTITIGLAAIIILMTGYFTISNLTKRATNTSLEKETSEQNASSLTPQSEEKEASFAIFTNGTFRVFTATMYHNLSSDVYIESNNPNLVKVKKNSVTWNDFFSTLPFSLTKNCLTTGTKQTFCTDNNKTLKFYLNGIADKDLLDKEIKNGDKALVSFGSENEAQIKEQLLKLNSLNNK